MQRTERRCDMYINTSEIKMYSLKNFELSAVLGIVTVQNKKSH